MSPLRACWPWLVVTGCYDPAYDHPACSASYGCPEGLKCNPSSLVCETEAAPCTSFSSQFDTCTLPRAGDLVIEGDDAEFNTGSLSLYVHETVPVEHMTLQTHASDVGAILAHDVRIAAGATLVVRGNKPMAIVASGRITIEDGASIDVSASVRRSFGANACKVPAGDGQGGRYGDGGGGGGGYNGRGGAGGAGSGGTVHGGNGAGSVDAPSGPQAGCDGGSGGDIGAGLGGSRGQGGGAIYLVASFQIDIGAGARLIAAGSGGLACETVYPCGGGGGGSGGMIMLEAPRIVAPHAKLSANGGGGGGGSGPQAGLPGSEGTDSTERAGRGAAGGADATPGGFGGSRLAVMGEDVTAVATGAGGGGGGGAGYIVVVSPDSQLSDEVSPAPTVRASPDHSQRE